MMASKTSCWPYVDDMGYVWLVTADGQRYHRFKGVGADGKAVYQAYGLLKKPPPMEKMSLDRYRSFLRLYGVTVIP